MRRGFGNHEERSGKMRKMVIFGTAGAVLIVAVAIVLLRRNHNGEGKQFFFERITRGNILQTVSSTGSTSAVTNVEVGTQVSGTILHIYVDFNDPVRAGQVLAVLDTIPLKAAVLDAKAGVAKSRAQLEQAQSDYRRNQPLFERNLISEADFIPIKTNLEVQDAALNSAQATLLRAQQNLDYATIRSPIHGTVIQRNVDVGQTVAASFNTPTLFIIAEDLTQMEVLAQVDESDIGQIKVGQLANFTVAAYPDSTFEGKVEQIRLQPTVVQNVVNYTVIVSAENRSNSLLPGMTATLDFIIAKRDSVLRVPNAALAFQPPPEILREYQKSLSKEAKSLPDSAQQDLRDLMRHLATLRSGQPVLPGAELLPNGVGSVWYLDRERKLSVAFFQTGITDGLNTEIVGGRGLRAGMEVITGLNPAHKGAGAGSRNRPRGFRIF